MTAIEPARLLEYAWLQGDTPVGRVRWQFAEGPGGARVTLTQTAPAAQPEMRVTALAAWHTHLEVLAQHLRGDTRCWEESRTEQLREQYAASTPS